MAAAQPLVLIAGPCVIESEAHAMSMAERLVKIAAQGEDAADFQGVLRQGQSLFAELLPGARA